jgi:isocitrate lyase
VSSLSFYVTAEAVTHKALQEAEFGSERDGYDAVKHQRFVGTGYFDASSRQSRAAKRQRPRLKGRPKQRNSMRPFRSRARS